MKYFDELKRSMEWLGEQNDTIFIGQAVEYAGTGMTNTLKDVSPEKLIKKAFGFTKPLVSNDDEEDGRNTNIVIRLLEILRSTKKQNTNPSFFLSYLGSSFFPPFFLPSFSLSPPPPFLQITVYSKYGRVFCAVCGYIRNEVNSFFAFPYFFLSLFSVLFFLPKRYN